MLTAGSGKSVPSSSAKEVVGGFPPRGERARRRHPGSPGNREGLGDARRLAASSRRRNWRPRARLLSEVMWEIPLEHHLSRFKPQINLYISKGEAKWVRKNEAGGALSSFNIGLPFPARRAPQRASPAASSRFASCLNPGRYGRRICCGIPDPEASLVSNGEICVSTTVTVRDKATSIAFS
jgi:hypothetical protein